MHLACNPTCSRRRDPRCRRSSTPCCTRGARSAASAAPHRQTRRPGTFLATAAPAACGPRRPRACVNARQPSGLQRQSYSHLGPAEQPRGLFEAPPKVPVSLRLPLQAAPRRHPPLKCCGLVASSTSVPSTSRSWLEARRAVLAAPLLARPRPPEADALGSWLCYAVEPSWLSRSGPNGGYGTRGVRPCQSRRLHCPPPPRPSTRMAPASFPSPS